MADIKAGAGNPWDMVTARFDDLDEGERARWLSSVETLMDQRRHERHLRQ